MKVFIMHKFKAYESTGNNYAFASAHRTRKAAEDAIRAEIAMDIDGDMDGSEDNTPEEREKIIKKAADGAFDEGDRGEDHNAVLYYGDFTAYYDITETNV